MQLRIEEKSTIGNETYSLAKQLKQTGKQSTELFDPPALSLDERGMILDCSKSFENLFGFRRSDLVWHHVSMLFSQLEGIELVKEGRVNSFLNYLCRCGQLFQAINRQGETLPSNLSFVRLEYKGKRILRLIVQPSLGGELGSLM
jgi:PAS domain S-box-containing protein